MNVLIDILGWVALLLWGMRMVRTGIVRAYGADLRTIIGRATANRFSAYASGVAVTTVLQSSTATTLMTLSFASRGYATLPMALAVVLGADLGTSLVAQVLSYRLDHLAPFLILAGVVAFLASSLSRGKDLGRAAIGLGLMLLSLQMIAAASLPLRQSETLALVIGGLSDDLLLLLLAVLLTWLAHSSLAVVLLVMSFAQSGVVGMHDAVVLVLGANLGGLIPTIIAALPEGAVARRIVLANTAFKVIGVAVALPLADELAVLFADIGAGPARDIVNLHTAFNLALGLAFIGLVGPAARLAGRLLPDTQRPDDPAAPRYLDRSTLATPSLALTCAERETLHMGDVVADMLGNSMEALIENDRRAIATVEMLDDRVDRLHEEIKLFVTELTRESLDEPASLRATEILAFTTNLEHIGDIIDKSLMDLARKRLKQKLSFSAEGRSELRALHARVHANLQVALGVFLSRDVSIARRLLDDKVGIRNEEWASAQAHLDRLRAGRIESLDSSALHLDALSDLKRIHSHICSVAYPILDRAGLLRPTRLMEDSYP